MISSAVGVDNSRTVVRVAGAERSGKAMTSDFLVRLLDEGVFAVCPGPWYRDAANAQVQG